MKISIIGSGNVAWHMAIALEEAGNQICEVYSRTIANAGMLVKKLFDATATNDLNLSNSKAKIFILAIKDDAIPQVLDHLILPENSILVHTSGSFGLDVFDDILIDQDSIEVGVFYPLMTFTKTTKVNYAKVPLCIEAETDTVENILVEIGQQISKIVYVIDENERKILHLAAVFANNFTNHILAQAQDILMEHDLDFELLAPIFEATFQKAMTSNSIHDNQTGPARRNDKKIIQKHRTLLAHDTDKLEVYDVLTQSITAYFDGKR